MPSQHYLEWLDDEITTFFYNNKECMVGSPYAIKNKGFDTSSWTTFHFKSTQTRNNFLYLYTKFLIEKINNIDININKNIVNVFRKHLKEHYKTYDADPIHSAIIHSIYSVI